VHPLLNNATSWQIQEWQPFIAAIEEDGMS
jgi:hypothetical protein